MESRAQSALLFFIKTLITCYICYIEKIHIIICSMKCWGKMQNMLRALNPEKKSEAGKFCKTACCDLDVQRHEETVCSRNLYDGCC